MGLGDREQYRYFSAVVWITVFAAAWLILDGKLLP